MTEQKKQTVAELLAEAQKDVEDDGWAMIDVAAFFGAAEKEADESKFGFIEKEDA